MWSYYTVHLRKLLECNLPHFHFEKQLRCEEPILQWSLHLDCREPTDLRSRAAPVFIPCCQHMIGWQVTADWLVAKHHGTIDDRWDDFITTSWLTNYNITNTKWKQIVQYFCFTTHASEQHASRMTLSIWSHKKVKIWINYICIDTLCSVKLWIWTDIHRYIMFISALDTAISSLQFNYIYKVTANSSIIKSETLKESCIHTGSLVCDRKPRWHHFLTLSVQPKVTPFHDIIGPNYGDTIPWHYRSKLRWHHSMTLLVQTKVTQFHDIGSNQGDTISWHYQSKPRWRRFITIPFHTKVTSFHDLGPNYGDTIPWHYRSKLRWHFFMTLSFQCKMKPFHDIIGPNYCDTILCIS